MFTYVRYPKKFCNMKLESSVINWQLQFSETCKITSKNIYYISLIMWSNFQVPLPSFCSHFTSVTEYGRLFHFGLTHFYVYVCVCFGFESESSLYCMFHLNPNLKFITMYLLLISIYQRSGSWLYTFLNTQWISQS